MYLQFLNCPLITKNNKRRGILKDNQTYSIISNILLNKSSELKHTEVFSLISLMTLMEILDLFQTEGITEKTKIGNSSDTSGSGDISNLINKLGGGNIDMGSIQQLLPLFIKLMNNNDITSLLNSGNNNSNYDNYEEKNNQTNTNETNTNETENKKKTNPEKTKRIKEEKNLDWSKLNL